MSQLTNEISDWFTYTPNIGKPLYAYQKKIIQTLQQGQSCIINKARQTGISTLLACYGLTRALAGDTVVITSPSQKQSKNVMNYIHNFLTTLRIAGHVAPTKEETATCIRFTNEGAIHSVPNSAATVRGIAAPDGLLIFDEFAHFLNKTDAEMMTAVIPMISRGKGQVVYCSTPFGEGNKFYELFHGSNELVKTTINWSECPDLNIDEIRKRVDAVTFAQEYDNKFIGEVNSYFPYSLLQSCIDNELEVST